MSSQKIYKYLCVLLLVLFVIVLCYFSCNSYKKTSARYNVVNLVITPSDTTLSNCYVTDFREAKEKAIVFTWDDLRPGITNVAQIFKKYNLKTTFFINTAVLKGNWKFNIKYPYLINELKDLSDNGFEFGTHTRNHVSLVSASLDIVETELKQSSEDILETLGYYPATMSHPTSTYNAVIDSIMCLYYLDSRYTSQKDKDSLYRTFQVRTEYDFNYHKRNLDSFIYSFAKTYVYGGHQLDGEGYEPMKSSVLDSLLNYLTAKYCDVCWITTFENLALYNRLKDGITLLHHKGGTSLDTKKVDALLNKYTHAQAIITLCFPNVLIDIKSKGLVRCWYDNGNTYCSIDIRKGKELQFELANSNYKYQRPMRNGLNK